MDISSFGKRQCVADILYFMSGSADVVRSHSSVSGKLNPQKKTALCNTLSTKSSKYCQ